MVTTVNRGPGSVGEVLSRGGQHDIEGGGAGQQQQQGEHVPLMQEDSLDADQAINLNGHAQQQARLVVPGTSPKAARMRRRGSSRGSHGGSSSEEEGDEEGEHHEMYENSTDDDGEGGVGESDSSDDEEGQESGSKVEIVYPGSGTGVHANGCGGGTGGANILMAKGNGKPRFCRKCNLPKPDRAHHCSTCGFCVLKMDVRSLSIFLRIYDSVANVHRRAN